MCDTGRRLVADGVAGKAEEAAVVLSGPGEEGHCLAMTVQAPVPLASNRELNEFLQCNVIFILFFQFNTKLNPLEHSRDKHF